MPKETRQQKFGGLIDATISGGSVSEIIESLEQVIGQFGLHMTAHPSWEGSSDYGFILSNRKLTQEDIEEIAVADEGGFTTKE